MKKTLKLALASAFGALMVFVGCTKDFTQDIQALGDRVSALESKVNALQAAIDKGAVITSVTPVLDSAEGGIKITLSNGESYVITNGKNGANGANGAKGDKGDTGAKGDKGDKGDTGAAGAPGTPGSVITIGANGNWFIDGKDTGVAAKGKDGANGSDGKDGVNGTDGKDGKDGADGKDAPVYTPGEDGYWYIDDVKSDKKWAADGVVTAVVTDGKLIISVDGQEIAVVNLTTQLAGLAANYDYVQDVNNYKYFYTEDNGSQLNMACFDYMFTANAEGTTAGKYDVAYLVGSNPTAFTYKVNPSNIDPAAYTWSINAIEWNSVSVGTKVLAGGKNTVYPDAIKVVKAEKYAKDPANVTVTTVLFAKPVKVSEAPNFKANSYPHARFELVAAAGDAVVRSADEEFGWETQIMSYYIYDTKQKVNVSAADEYTFDKNSPSLELPLDFCDLRSTGINKTRYNNSVAATGKEVLYKYEVANMGTEQEPVYYGKIEDGKYVWTLTDQQKGASNAKYEQIVKVIAYTVIDNVEYRYFESEFTCVYTTDFVPVPHNYLIDSAKLHPGYIMGAIDYLVVADSDPAFDLAKIGAVRVKGKGNELVSGLTEHFKDYKFGTVECAEATVTFEICNFKATDFQFIERDADCNVKKTADERSVVEFDKTQLDKMLETQNSPAIIYNHASIIGVHHVLVKVTEECGNATHAKAEDLPVKKSAYYYVVFNSNEIAAVLTDVKRNLKTNLEPDSLDVNSIVKIVEKATSKTLIEWKNGAWTVTETGKAAPYNFTADAKVVFEYGKGKTEIVYDETGEDTKESFGDHLFLDEQTNRLYWFNDGTYLQKAKYVKLNIVGKIVDSALPEDFKFELIGENAPKITVLATADSK